MLIDMHVHTNRYSGCSILDPYELVRRASELKLSGIVITEHDYVWSLAEINELKRATKTDLLILRGQEVSASSGHLLVLGFYGELGYHLEEEEIIERVHDNDGVVLLAHPFRYGRNADVSIEKLKARFSSFDGIEVFNGNQDIYENDYGKRVWESLGIVGVGGSDAHSTVRVGRYLTWFQNEIRDEEDLVKEIKNGRCRPVTLNDFRLQGDEKISQINL
jgi:hypothetical protein